MKTVVIGLGIMGQHHARILNELGCLYGVYDTNPIQRDRLAKQYNCHAYSYLKDLLLDKSFNSVSIAVPTPCHKEIAIECLSADLHILLEKPITESIETANEILQAINKTNKVFAVGYIERCNPAVIALTSLIESNFFGEITSINMKRVGGEPRSANNIILDLMTHDIDLLLFLLKKPPQHIYTTKLIHNNIIDSAQILFDFNGISVTCEANWIAPIKMRKIEITGTKGFASIDLINQTITEITKIQETSHKYFGESLKNEFMIFQNAVDNNIYSNHLVSCQDAISTLKITLQALK